MDECAAKAPALACLEECAVVALFQPHDLLLHNLDILRELEERLDDFGFGGLVGERGEQRMNAGHAGGDLLGGGANLRDGGGAIHEEKVADGQRQRKPAPSSEYPEKKNMRVVVTCGPSYEPIDEVRRITNFSTGELGTQLANHLARAGCEVVCFRGVGATSQARVAGAKVVPFATNQHLQSSLEELPHREEVAAVFHAAALCDYRVKSVLTSGGAEVAATKIPSRAGELTLTLEPSSKLIHSLRDLFPASRIVGWKYELVGSRADVLAAAIRQLAESRSDACVMNGAAYGSGFGVLEPKMKPVHCADNTALCAHLTRWLRLKE